MNSEATPSSGGIFGAVSKAVSNVAEGAKSMAKSVLPASVTGPALNTSTAVDALGAKPETPGYTAAGGRRRHKTGKHRSRNSRSGRATRKTHKKTRRHRKH
jgi:hypothetical protein